MCGRFSLVTDITAFLQQVGVPLPQGFARPVRFNVSPSQAVVGLVADPVVRLEAMEWGFVPSWAKPDAPQKPVINARVESVREGKPYFRAAFKSGRCVILADGFYEWGVTPEGKQPFRIQTKDRGVFAMAGLVGHPHLPDGDERTTCAIITLPANDFMQNIHDRMPAILRAQDLRTWLDPKTPAPELFHALEPFPSDDMTAYRVSLAVNNPRNDTPVCIESIDP